MPTRRDLYRTGTMVLGFAMTMLLAVPGVAFVLHPLRRKLGAVKSYPLARLNELVVGVPRAFPIVDERQDAWVRYPKEPVGLVWLIRQADPKEPVIAFTAECPHLGCAVNLSADRKFFRCPCHDSEFRFDGTPENKIPPRGMDRLEVEPLKGPEALIQVKFQRFRSQTEEKIPLA
jgi:menaquinol-cytochrome c reductase iron-sulfur subunit